MSIFDPRKLSNVDSPGFTSYGDSSIDTLIQHYGEDWEAQTIDGEEYLKKTLISLELNTEWKTFRQFSSNYSSFIRSASAAKSRGSKTGKGGGEVTHCPPHLHNWAD